MEVYHHLFLCLKQPLKYSGGILWLIFGFGLSVGLVLLLGLGGLVGLVVPLVFFKQ